MPPIRGRINPFGIKPLTRQGINASVLLRLLDARFTVEDQARIGMVEANVAHCPIWFNSNPDLTISLEDRAPEKALTLRINTSGYHMIEGSRPLALYALLPLLVSEPSSSPSFGGGCVVICVAFIILFWLSRRSFKRGGFY